jgi:hypothetical protein
MRLILVARVLLLAVAIAALYAKAKGLGFSSGV